jgi:hypothetical protein
MMSTFSEPRYNISMKHLIIHIAVITVVAAYAAMVMYFAIDV